LPDSIDRPVLIEAIRTMPFAWFLFDAADRLVFASGRAEELAGSPAVSDAVESTRLRARARLGSAVAHVSVHFEARRRAITVEARHLVLLDAPTTVVWAVERDDLGDDAQLQVERAMAAVDEARARLDDLIGELERGADERDRLVGILEAVVNGLDAGVVVVDRSLVITDASDRAAVLMGATADLVGRHLANVVEPVGAQLARVVEPCLAGVATQGVVSGPTGALSVGCASYEVGTRAVLVLHELSDEAPPAAPPARRGGP
jgi:PAS domain-containing protein